ncbi:MAG: purine-nucleoside phosphorylase [Candidatus Eisenbacteria bacterium]
MPAAILSTLRDAFGDAPVAGAVVLGSGLGGLLEEWRPARILETAGIPGYPASGVAGHAGRLAMVEWGRARGLVFQGRVHFYEGYRRPDVTMNVRVAASLGARWILLSNASGSVDPLVPPGTIVVVEDHIRLLVGRAAAHGAMSGGPSKGSPYDTRRTEEAFAMLGREGLRAQRGILFGGLGPSYETAAEVEMIRRLGATVACMSTVIEAEEARLAGLDVAAFSMVTNLATGLAAGRLTHDEVVAAAKRIGPALARAIDRLVRSWAEEPVPDQAPG